MSAKLDQSLDTIVAAHRKNARPRRVRGKTAGAKPASAPVGGVKKPTKPVKKIEKGSSPAIAAKGESKIIISNLPSDVNEGQIKEYFSSTIGPVKKVLLVYGPQGQSRGIANVTFSRGDSAAKAVQELNGVKVDGRPMKVDVIVDAKNAPPAPEPKKLSDRISQPKSAAKPKPATETKAKSAEKGKGGRRARGGRGGGRVGRVKKSEQELDAEMVDYFADAPGQNGGAVQATNGDIPMDADIQ